MNKRFLFTVFSVLVIAAVAGGAIFLAKGYRFSPKTGAVKGTGIISVASIPDQASVYIDGHLTTASNATVSSLTPKNYDVKITKDGFISWEKNVEVKEGLVTQIKATLFPAIPTVYPMTFNGVEHVTLSADGQRLVFIVTGGDSNPSNSSTGIVTLKRNGVWVWEMLGNPLSFAGGPEPHRVSDLIPGLDYAKAIMRWSPDSTQVLVSLPDRSLLMDENKFNDYGRDITPTLDSTLNQWVQDQKSIDSTRFSSLKDLNLRSEASGAALLKWSADETKFFFSQDGKTDFKLVDLGTNSVNSLPKAYSFSWLPDSRHLVMVESNNTKTDSGFPVAKISIIETDGSNKSEIYVGNFDPNSVLPWPDQSRLVIVSSLPTPTASKPNLFGVNLK